MAKFGISNDNGAAEVIDEAPGSDTGQRALAVRVISSLAGGEGGGGTQYAEDSASAGGEQVTMAGVVRKDSGTSLVDTDGDRTELQVDSSGNLRVNVAAGGGAGGTSSTDDSAFTPGAGSGTPVMGFADEASPDSVDEGDVGVVRMTLTRALHVNLRDASGNELAVGGGTQYDEDTAATAAEKVTMAGVVRKDTAASMVDTDGDRTELEVDGSGRLWVNASGAAVPVTDNGGALTVDDGGSTLSIDDGGGSITVDGTVSVSEPVTVDGTVDTELTTADLDTGGGTDTRAVVGLVSAESGGGTLVGSANPLPISDAGGSITVDDGGSSLTIDGTVTVTEPVSVDDNGGSLTVDASDLDIRNLNPTDDIVQVRGAAADGAAVAGNPVLVAGQDGTNAQSLSTNASGHLNIADGGNSITVDGTVSVTEPVSIDDNGGSITVDGTVTVTDGLNIEGDVAHDTGDSGNPVKQGAKAIAHGANPTAVAASDRTDLYANRAGIPFTIGGHPNIVTREYVATGAQTDDPIITVSTGAKIVVTSILVVVDNATTVDVGVRIGFGTANVPTVPTDGNTVDGVVLTHPGIAAGSGIGRGDGSGILAIGADNEDLRITNEAPTSGSLRAIVTYYTIES